MLGVFFIVYKIVYTEYCIPIALYETIEENYKNDNDDDEFI